MITKHVTILVAGIAAMAVAYAQPGPWQVSAGASYRLFTDDLDIEGISFVNPDFGGAYVNGTAPEDADVGTVIVYDNRDYTDIDAGGQWTDEGVWLDRVAGAAGNEDLDDAWGGILQVSRDLGELTDGLVLGIEFALAIHTADLDEGGTVTATGEFWSPASQQDMLPVSTVRELGIHPDMARNDQVNTQLSTVAGTIGYDLDLELYTISAGLRAACAPIEDRLFLAFALGPEIAIADADVKISQAVTNATTGAGIYTGSDKDSETDVLYGGYASLGAEWLITDSIGLGAEVRYDLLLADLRSDYVKGDLSGGSGVLKLTVRF